MKLPQYSSRLCIGILGYPRLSVDRPEAQASLEKSSSVVFGQGWQRLSLFDSPLQGVVKQCIARSLDEAKLLDVSSPVNSEEHHGLQAFRLRRHTPGIPHLLLYESLIVVQTNARQTARAYAPCARCPCASPSPGKTTAAPSA